jgi:alpha-D-ribose 1-methylphosphonate 5-triphosphate synthase subunit PhnH
MSAVPAPGFADPVHDAQQAFRVALEAMARPGSLHEVGTPIAGLPLGAAQAQLLLTLTDEDTPAWWQHGTPELRQWLRFHTGARSVTEPGEASFAVVTAAADLPSLDRFDIGTLQAPDRSCTLLIEVPSLATGAPLQAHGPGIRDSVTLRIAGLAEGFWAEWQASHAAFPQGLDIFFTCGSQVLALPRTARIGRLQEV